MESRGGAGFHAQSPHSSGPSIVACTGRVLALVLVSGVLLWVATGALSKMDIGGPGWSLKGNGALGLTFTVGPAIIAAAWTLLSIMRIEGHPTREVIYSGVVAFVLTFAVVFGPFLPLGFWPALLSPVVALTVGVALAGRNGLATRGGVVLGGVLLGLFLLGVLSQRQWTAWAYQLAPLLVAPLLAIPAGIGMISTTRGRTFRLAGCALVPVALTVGLAGTPWLVWVLTGPK